jgi:hypothetical protein
MAVAKRVAEWWSIEVFDAEALPARRWKDSYQDGLTEAAVTRGAISWEWHEHRYGVVFEVLFESEQEWDAFRALPAVRSALDGVPDPVNGLLVYKGRGGGSGPRKPRKPRPAPSASSMELLEPAAEEVVRLTRAMADEQDGVMIGAPDFAGRTPHVAARA